MDCFTSLPFGQPQRMMTLNLSGLDGVQCYLDDVIVFISTHEKRLKAVLHQMHSSGLKRFWVTLSLPQVRPNLYHIHVVTKAASPSNVTALHLFMGLTGWYSKFIPSYA